MENKYYLDEQGLIKLIQSISRSISNKTSGSIETNENEVINPNNFVTAKGIVDYIKANGNNRKLKINKQSTTSEGIIEDNIIEYDGSEEVQINLNLVTARDITNLFNNN